MISTKWGYDYATQVYPETRAINKILVENNFFKSTTPPGSETALIAEFSDEVYPENKMWVII